LNQSIDGVQKLRSYTPTSNPGRERKNRKWGNKSGKDQLLVLEQSLCHL